MALLSFSVGSIDCGRPVDLEWVDESALLASTSISAKTPSVRDLQPTPLILAPTMLNANHQNVYIQFECKEKKDEDDIEMVESIQQPSCSVTTALMTKRNQYPDPKNKNLNRSEVKQYNVLANYIKDKKYGVSYLHLEDTKL